jgi:hypothetical protein
MKIRILVLSVVLGLSALPSSSWLSAQTSSNTLRKFGLRIYAADPREQVRVRGAVWTDGSSTEVLIVDQHTPFDLITFGNVINGIFRGEGQKPIRVEVKDESTGMVSVSAMGSAIVVGQGLAQNPEWAFIKTTK